MKAIINETTTLWGRITAMCGKLIFSIWAFISPIQVVLLAVGMFIISDTVLGIWKAKKIGETISSKRMADVIRKMLVYQLVVITFYCIDYAIIHDIVYEIVNIHFALTKAVALVLISIEFFSMDESFKAATGKGLLERLTDIVNKYKSIKSNVTDK
jgi:hypothetical protein